MIVQLGALFGKLITDVVNPIATAAAPVLLDTGKAFLQRELNRKLVNDQQRRIKAEAVQVLNSPGVSVARVGGTRQPVGGRVQRSTFTPAAFTPAQTPIGNVPLLPVGGPPAVFNDVRANPVVRSLNFGLPFAPPGVMGPPSPPGNLPALRSAVKGASVANGALAVAGPKFATDEMGKVIKFVPSPRPGEGFISVQQARQLGLNPTRPFWRFNRAMGQFEKMKPRRMNPFNFKAASRAGRRVERTLDAVKELVRIEKKMSSGKVSLRKKKKKKRC